VSDQINDDGAEMLDVALMPVAMLDMFRQCATTSRFTPKAGSELMSSSLLYPFYGGKSVPDTVVSTPDYWGLTTVTLHRDAAQVGTGECVVVIVNALPCAVTVTRPYRDGGYLMRLPRAADGTANLIAGKTTVDSADYFGVGAYVNGIASIFYGGGAVLFIKPADGSFPTAALAYGSSINGGCGLGATANASSIGDAKAWFSKTADHTDFVAGNGIVSTNGVLKVSASVAPWDKLKSDRGGVFTILLEHS
jgi:hypothetical protein